VSLRFRPLDSIALASILFIASCTAYNYDDDAPPMPRRSIASDESAPQPGMLALPPPDWWREASIADMVKPTAEQVTVLDRLQTEQGDEIARMQRDVVIAERDLRGVLESNKPSAGSIIAAGTRVRTMRDEIFGRQLRYLAAERELLTREQWSALEDAIRMRRRERMREGMGRGRGPGGVYPGRGGRRPGGWGW